MTICPLAGIMKWEKTGPLQMQARAEHWAKTSAKRNKCGRKFMAGETTITEKSRIRYLDYLRVLAAFAVILLHVSAQHWDTEGVRFRDRFLFAAYNSMAVWPVNMFVMLSGALFLDPERKVDTRTLYSKYILRIVTAFLFWSAVYALDKLLCGESRRDVLLAFLQGNFHLWYLPMAVAFYTLVPVVRKLTDSKKLTRYLLLLMLVWNFLLPDIAALLGVMNRHSIPLAGLFEQSLRYHLGTAQFPLSGVFLFYFVLGLYLHKNEVAVSKRAWIYALGIGSYLVKLLLCAYYLLVYGTADVPFSLNLSGLAITASVFLFAKYALPELRLLNGKKSRAVMRSLTQCSFGIYLVHMLVREKLAVWFGLTTLSFRPMLSVPLLSILVMGISWAIVMALRRIPVIQKYAL